MFKIHCLLISVLLLSGCGHPSSDLQQKPRALESIPLELTTLQGDQSVYYKNDEIQFLLSLGSDAYIYMYHVNANGKVHQILPDPAQPSNFYSAGYYLTIPEYKETYRFKVTQPFGPQSIWVFASDQLIATDTSTQSIDDVRAAILQAARQAFGLYELKIETKRTNGGG